MLTADDDYDLTPEVFKPVQSEQEIQDLPIINTPVRTIMGNVEEDSIRIFGTTGTNNSPLTYATPSPTMAYSSTSQISVQESISNTVNSRLGELRDQIETSLVEKMNSMQEIILKN